MANYRQGNLAAANAANAANAGGAAGSPAATGTTSPSYTVQQAAPTQDYANLLQ